MREQRMLVFYAELRGGKATLWVNLLSVNEYFSGKRNNKRAFLVSLFMERCNVPALITTTIHLAVLIPEELFIEPAHKRRELNITYSI